jgi:DNA transformation protein
MISPCFGCIYFDAQAVLGQIKTAHNTGGGMSEKQSIMLSKQLKNIGPKLAAKLIEAGIDSPEKLRSLGARAAFDKMYQHGDRYGDFNAAYLYALEGAIRDCDWLQIPESLKTEYKQYANELQKRRRR